MPNPVQYVNALLPVDVAEHEPPKPVQSSKSRPQKGAKFNVTYTLYRFGGFVHAMGRIPNALRGSKNLGKSRTNSGMTGKQPSQGSSVIVRVIPSSYGDRVTS